MYLIRDKAVRFAAKERDGFAVPNPRTGGGIGRGRWRKSVGLNLSTSILILELGPRGPIPVR